MCMKKQERREELIRIMQAHKPLRPCLSCGIEPKLKYIIGEYSKEELRMHNQSPQGRIKETYEFYCPRCNFSAGSYLGLQAALTSWHRQNLQNNEHYAELWSQSYYQQQSTAAELAAAQK